jgi:hypothetical protein
MTTLKTYYADEIASALDAQLKDESFVGLYKKAQTAGWWTKGAASQAFKAEMDAAKTAQEAAAVHNKWLASGSEGATQLGKEHDDFSELIDYSEDKRQKLTQPQAAEDDGCAAAKDGEPCAHDDDEMCPKCSDPGLAIAVDFAIRHVVKVADALDKAGYIGVAGALDETLQKLAAQRSKHSK